MMRRYVFLVITLSNSVVLWSSMKEVFMDRRFGIVVPRDLSLLSFGNLLNCGNSKALIELEALNKQNKQKQQESLCKPLEQTNSDYMYNLYQKASLFLACKSPHYQDLIECINACNYVKRFSINEDQMINEDHMGKFAFERDDVKQKTSLFFYFLKNYNQKAAKTREIPPTTWSPIAERLDIASIGSLLAILIKDTNALFFNKVPHYHELISFIHSNQKFTQLGDSSIVIDEDWKSKFLYAAFAVLSVEEPHNALRDIVMLVTKAKDLNKIKEISDLGYHALSYETTALDAICMLPLSVTYKSKKGQIALLCKYIEQYNKARGKKITPSVRLYNIYKALAPLHIIFPDTFDLNLLNAEKIAFAEYAKLLDDIGKIKEAYDDVVEYCIQHQYPPQLTTVTK